MSNNDTFDKKFRHKMENFEPDYQEQAWEKFAPQLIPHQPTSFFQGKIAYFLYAVSAVALLSIIFYFYPKNAIQTIPQQVDNQNEKRQEIAQDMQNPTSSLSHTEAENSLKNAPQQNPILPSNPMKEENTPPTQDSKKISPIHEKNVFQKAWVATEKETIKVNSAANDLKVEELVAPIMPKDSLKVLKKTLAFHKIEKIDRIEYQNFEWENKEKTLTSVSINLPALPKQKANIQLSVGTNMGLEKEKIANGLVFNATFRQRWGINIGVNYAQFRQVSFKDADEFYQQNQVEFKSIVPTTVPSNALFSEIETQQSKWELPVSIQYQHPIYKNIAVVAQLGTNLLLSAKQHFSYHLAAQGQAPQIGDFHKHEMPPSFGKRNLPTLGLGLQANWLRWQLQGTSYLAGSQEDMHTPHRERHPSLGFQLRLNYRIFKT